MLNKIIVLCLLPLCVFAAVNDQYIFANAQDAQRFRNLTHEFRCLVCQNQDLADSQAPLANDLRFKIVQHIQAGETDAQIKDHLVERYGEFILYKPPLSQTTWALWFGPFLLLLLGGLVLFKLSRRRGKL